MFIKCYGFENVSRHPRQGIPNSDLRIFQRIAAEQKVIIGVRPVEAMAKRVLSGGRSAGKPLEVKMKSSNWGPACGFIPMEQMYSKLTNETMIHNYNVMAERLLAANRITATQLALTDFDIEELVKFEMIKIKRSSADQMEFTATSPLSKEFVFFAVKSHPSGMWAINNHAHQPVLLAADPQSGKPFTADYDLLFVSVHLSKYGPADKLSFPVMYEENLKSFLQAIPDIMGGESWTPDQMQRYVSLSPATYYQNMDRVYGNCSKRVMLLIIKLNEAFGRPMVRHGADEGNPHSVPLDNIPATIFLPEIIPGAPDTILLAETYDEFRTVLQGVKDANYYVFLNPAWKQVTYVKRGSFDQASMEMFKKWNPPDDQD
ncbi:MAG: hypothetical protein GY750_18140 [Lentisphaerae bacterium]|nr:hypothetical protein [Lentisphaerota bacterium]MCP4103319.1 hypothetical protein [Lentisphaerota bacterium]